MIIIHIVTILIALCALLVWIRNALQAGHLNARLYAIAPLVWLLNFTAYHLVSWYCGVPESLHTDLFLAWAGSVRLHAAVTITIMGLMSWMGRNGRHGTN